jgi:excinuclease ABC subunit C
MPIPTSVKIKDNGLPPEPGVYFMKDAVGRLLYVGKATSLRARVSSYFTRPQEPRIASLVAKIRRIDYETTPTAIEALMLEARLIKALQPPYNVMEKDDKSMIRLAFTKEDFPRPVLVREHDLERTGEGVYIATFGPFGTAASVRAALDALRPAFPWTTCRPGAKRPCFYHHLKLCPGVCTGGISPVEYRRIIRGLIRFFAGDRAKATSALAREMKKAAKDERFEDATVLRNRLRALADLRDINVLKREERLDRQARGRIEGYDISNVSGTAPVGSMVVFEDGEPRKSEYRIFHVETPGPDDFAMLGEVLRRRFKHVPGGTEGVSAGRSREAKAWKLPDILLIDGGAGQVAVARAVLAEAKLDIPVVGLAKGPDRKRDVPVFDHSTPGLAALVTSHKRLFQQVRDEAHRFAVSHHRKRRKKEFISK